MKLPEVSMPRFTRILHFPKIERPSLFEIVWCAIVLTGLGYLLSVVREVGTTGESIPSRPPDETRRFHHPAGFSIIVPENWEACDFAGVAILMRPSTTGSVLRRSKASMAVYWEVDEATPEAVPVQGAEGNEVMKVVRRDTFDDPGWSVFQRSLHRGGRRYDLSYGIAEERTTMPDMPRRFLETFRDERDHRGGE